MINLFIIKIITFLSIFLCFCLLTTSNPIYSAFLLISLFLSVSGILLILNIKFLTFVIIILYAGAISILFLFIIFTLNLKPQLLKIKAHSISSLVIVISLIKVFYSLLTALFTTDNSSVYVYNELQNNILSSRLSFEWNEIEVIGNLLYSHYWVLFLLIGYVLLLVMVGVVTISKSLDFSK